MGTYLMERSNIIKNLGGQKHYRLEKYELPSALADGYLMEKDSALAK
jgi:hypothetical protein